VITLNRKGLELPWATVIVGLVAVVVFLAVLGVFNPTQSQARTFTSYYTLKTKLDKCKLDATTSDITLNKDNDKDGDGYIDYCDTCVCPRAECKNIIKNNPYDGDNDLVPRGCDVDDDNSKKTGCKLPVFTEDGRCLEGSVS